MHRNDYPKLTFKEMYLLHQGYRSMKWHQPESCNPPHGYVSMFQKEFSSISARRTKELKDVFDHLSSTRCLGGDSVTGVGPRRKHAGKRRPRAGLGVAACRRAASRHSTDSDDDSDDSDGGTSGRSAGAIVPRLRGKFGRGRERGRQRTRPGAGGGPQGRAMLFGPGSGLLQGCSDDEQTSLFGRGGQRQGGRSPPLMRAFSDVAGLGGRTSTTGLRAGDDSPIGGNTRRQVQFGAGPAEDSSVEELADAPSQQEEYALPAPILVSAPSAASSSAADAQI